MAAPAVGDGEVVPLYPDSAVTLLRVGDLVTVDFGAVLLQVIEVGNTCRARVLNGGAFGSNKAVSVDRSLALPALTEFDDHALQLCWDLGLTTVALSFTNRPSDITDLRAMTGTRLRVIGKIESRNGLAHLAGILGVADAVLIDRGDLSRELPIESLPFIQKDIIRRANLKRVPVYVATNLLESMVSGPRPTRAEVNDVINTLADGADGLVLAAETAIGKYPVGCVSMIRSLIDSHEDRTRGGELDYREPASTLTRAHGGRLVRRVEEDGGETDVATLPTLEIDERTMLDVRQIAEGSFSPLDGFMAHDELESVLRENRLPDGCVWTMPVILQVSDPSAGFSTGEVLGLARGGAVKARLEIRECFQYDLETLAGLWFGTRDSQHPGVARLYAGSDRFLAGKVDLLSERADRRSPFDLTPAQSRLIFQHRHWRKVVGFHTRNAAHRVHEALQLAALEDQNCDGILVLPVVGPKKRGDFSGSIIMKSYELLIENHYPSAKTVLGSFETYSRYAGPREAVFTALCHKNFGCTHFIVGRDHTGVGDHYAPDAARRLFEELGDIGIKPVFFNEVYYPQWSLQNRPTMVTSKPANGDGPGRCCSTSLGLDSASPF